MHQLQVLDESLPNGKHDFTVDYIVTPDEVIHSSSPYRPASVVWTALGHDKIAGIAVLAAMASDR